MCINETCVNKEPNDQLYFDFNICIGDATGAMKWLRITSDFAVKLLGEVTYKTNSFSYVHKAKRKLLFKLITTKLFAFFLTAEDVFIDVS